MTRLPRPAPLALALLLAFGSPLWAQGIAAPAASTAQAQFNIPAQPLSDALNAWARQTRTQIAVQQALVAGKQAPAVSGWLTPRQALERLLAGSGLAADISGAEVFIRLGPPDAGASESTLATVTVTAEAERGATSEGTGSYAARAATIGKTAQSLREIPQSVTVVTRQRIEDQNLRDLDRVLEQTPGIVVRAWDAQNSTITARGFDVDDLQFDGVTATPFRANNSPSSSPDMALYDRVEVLRGSSGLLKGTGNPSAAVNLVRKRPTREFQAGANLLLGSWKNARVEADISGPLTADGRVRGRLVGVHEDTESYIDVIEHKKSLLYGIAEVDLTPATLLTAGLRTQQWDGIPWGWGMPLSTTGEFLNLPRSTYLGQRWQTRRADESEAFAQLEHRLQNGWKLEGALNWLRIWGREKYTFGIGGANGVGAGYAQGVDISNPAISIRGGAYDGGGVQLGGDLRASGPFELLGRTHELVIGWDARRNRTRSFTAPLTQDLYSARYSYVGNPYLWNHDQMSELGVLPATAYGTTDTTSSGLYATARLSLHDDVKLILGARLSRWKTVSESYNLPLGNRTRKTGYAVNDELTPFAGLVWNFSPAWSAYASYADIFTPQNAIDRNGDLVKPIVGVNYEVGVKGELAGGALNTSFAVFRIEQKNRAQTDFDGPSPCPGTGSVYCSIASGKVRSEGFEAELSGEVDKTLQLFAGYTFNTTKYLEDSSSEGKIFNAFTPKHILRLWASYRLPGGWNRLSVGGGLSVLSEAYQESGSLRISQKGYSLVNLAAAYRINDRLSLALNVDNLFDKVYYTRIGSKVNGSIYGDPRKYTLTLRAKF